MLWKGLAACTLLGALMIAGCTGSVGQSQPSQLAGSAVAPSQSATLQAEVYLLGSLLDKVPVNCSPEPKADISAGTYQAEVLSVETTGSAPSVLVDFVSAELSPTTDQLWWNRHEHQQRIPLAHDRSLFPDGALLAMRDSSYALRVVPPDEFARRIDGYADPSEHAYWVLLDGGQAVAIWEAWFPWPTPAIQRALPADSHER
jgi:hypothetical protein